MAGERPAPFDPAATARDPWALGAAFFLLVGGLMAGIFVPELRFAGVAMGIAVVFVWSRQLLSRSPDVVDLAAVCAVLLLAIGAGVSTQPRTSVEYVAWAIALVALLAILRRRFTDASARDRLLSIAGWIAIGFALVVSAIWTWQALGWVRAGGPGGVPPLQLDYPDDWFRNMNVLPVYLALMAPGVVHLWLVRGVRWPVVAGVLALGVVTLLSASRAAWLGLLLGLVAFLALRGLQGMTARSGGTFARSRRTLLLIAGGLALAVMAGWLSGGLRSVVEAAADIATLSSRLTIWRAALEAWAAHPVFGSGLGTITAELLDHGLATVAAGPAPHAHDIFIQLLAEAGVVGVIALAALTVALLLRAVRPGSGALVSPGPVRAAAAGALVAFAVDGLADNHTALGGIAVLVVANAALLAPAGLGAPVAGRWDRATRAATTVGLGTLGALVLVWGAGAIAWGRSQALLLEGSYATSGRVLELAYRLDPNLALYDRELAKVRRLEGRPGDADALLRRAAELNAADPNTWRTLGALALADGRLVDAIAPLQRSLALDATQLNTHLLLAMALDRLGRTDAADERYVSAILLQPRLLLSDGWAAIGVAPERLEALAATAWQRGTSDAAVSATRLAELAVVRADDAGLEQLIASRSVPEAESWQALLAAETGDPSTAAALLTESEPDGRTSVDYWANAALVHELAGLAPATARDYRLASLLREGRAPASSEPSLAYPVTRDANDFWMYARSTAWLTIDVGLRLPDPQRGGWLRLHDPGRIELASARAPRLAAERDRGGATP